MIKKDIILVVGLFFSILFSSLAQSTYTIGVLPSFTLTKKLNPNWKISTNAQVRFSAYQGEFSNSEMFQTNVDYVLTDISILVNRKVSLNTSLAVGYLTRFRNNEHHNRLFQQFIISQKYNSLGIVHRFSTDQTFRPNQKTEFRGRYRLAFDRPLKGNKLNPKEFYLKVNNEYLISLQNQEWNNEIRLIPFLGFAFTDKNKLEMGIDYRISSLGDEFLKNNFWWSLNYYLSF
ncbi:DUF2490 domain-containing protein [Bernardetia sp. OM2101]|uniref:DUF2490 domain-containing protein n=1 Tax=Bernardetia sp. OM2101 TaxID=3344876 RepID=UPI0035CEC994